MASSIFSFPPFAADLANAWFSGLFSHSRRGLCLFLFFAEASSGFLPPHGSTPLRVLFLCVILWAACGSKVIVDLPLASWFSFSIY